ncbi:hypothetical protein LC593_01125 [Nostoc sp. CHAB 5844]|nr:hypothetical protein [Nostoc sp. CHAB 5844]
MNWYYTTESDRQKALIADFQKHFTQPIHARELISLIADLIIASGKMISN